MAAPKSAEHTHKLRAATQEVARTQRRRARPRHRRAAPWCAPPSPRVSFMRLLGRSPLRDTTLSDLTPEALIEAIAVHHRDRFLFSPARRPAAKAILVPEMVPELVAKDLSVEPQGQTGRRRPRHSQALRRGRQGCKETPHPPCHKAARLPARPFPLGRQRVQDDGLLVRPVDCERVSGPRRSSAELDPPEAV